MSIIDEPREKREITLYPIYTAPEVRLKLVMVLNPNQTQATPFSIAALDYSKPSCHFTFVD
jgi:hypothetical protein